MYVLLRDRMDRAAGLVAEIHAEIADRAFEYETIDDIGGRTAAELGRSELRRPEKPALSWCTVAGKRVVNDVLTTIALVLVNRVEKSDGDVQPGQLFEIGGERARRIAAFDGAIRKRQGFIACQKYRALLFEHRTETNFSLNGSETAFPANLGVK